jgi:SAM-dependent methyltransferase
MIVPALKQVSYDPARYLDIETVEEAVNIITTPTEGMTAKQRWANETLALMPLIERHVMPESRVLDYGCGIGRLAKPLVTKHGCRVVGIDISPNMRALAASCVDSPYFAALDPALFDMLRPDYFDAAIAVWALQHCIDLEQVLERIHNALMEEARLFIVNNTGRCIPVSGGDWADDGLDMEQMIAKAGFRELERGKLDESVAPGWMREGTFWAVYQKT